MVGEVETIFQRCCKCAEWEREEWGGREKSQKPRLMTGELERRYIDPYILA